jgi:hypothetical protein
MNLNDIEYMRAYENQSLQPGNKSAANLNKRMLNTDEFKRRTARVSQEVLHGLDPSKTQSNGVISRKAIGVKTIPSAIFTRTQPREILTLEDVERRINNLFVRQPKYPEGRTSKGKKKKRRPSSSK